MSVFRTKFAFDSNLKVHANTNILFYLAILLIFFITATKGAEFQPAQIEPYKYDISKVYVFSREIRRITENAIHDDILNGRYTRHIKKESEHYIIHVYDHNGIYVEFNRDLTAESIILAHIPSSILPKNMLRKIFYIKKFDVVGFDMNSKVFIIRADADIITINFDGSLVKDIHIDSSLN
jgi:hypothetical protein